MRYFASLMIMVYPIGIPLMYSVLLFKARGELAIDEFKPYYLKGANAKCSKSALKTFSGYFARTSIKLDDKVKQRELEEAWGKLKREHQLSFLITPYEQRVYWFEVVEVFRRLMLSGALILFGAGSVKQVIIACALCLLADSKFVKGMIAQLGHGSVLRGLSEVR